MILRTGESRVDRLTDIVARIGPLDAVAMGEARARQTQLTKPPGSLGRLEELAVQVAGIRGVRRPRLPRKAVIVMAADHGITAEGVSAYPSAVTAQMVLNFLRGGAAINVLARRTGARLRVVDIGIDADLPAHPDMTARKVGRGTRNAALEPAMTRAEALDAIAVGLDVLADEVERGLDLVAIGEMGIGNTTAASAIVATLTGAPVAAVTGRGTGLDDAGVRRKITAIERALATNRPDPRDPLDVLSKVGGFEIAGLVGVILGAAARRIPVVLDGFIAGAAALVAVGLGPAARDYLIPAHASVEIGHRVALAHLELAPLLDLGLRLGEGTGAAVAMHLIDDALAIHDEMATFAEAGIAGPAESEC